MGSALPWSGIAGATINGRQTVVATGGKLGYSYGKPILTVIGPGGTLGTTFGGTQTFSPAANGSYQSITVVNNLTRVARLNFP